MLERLLSRLLNNVLSQYFDYQSNNNGDNGSTSEEPSSLGVWSGYIALDNLRLKTAVINDILQQQGIPLEVLHATIRRVEITVPWSKLRSSSGRNNHHHNNKEGAVVVIVIDGIHVLGRMLYEFHDAKMRQRDVQQRRAKLQEAQAFVETPSETASSSSSWFSSLGGIKDFVQRRISKGLVQQLADYLHVHIRDLHIRLEDAETDPAHPCAFGIVMESMHVQHREDDTMMSMPPNKRNNSSQESNNSPSAKNNNGKEIVRKVAQVNHYALYWNALGYEEGLSLEHCVLHQLSSAQNSPHFIAAALDRGIARRATALWSAPGGRLVVPTHTYLLMPVDCTLQMSLTVDPQDTGLPPTIEASMHVEAIRVQIRDFQCHQILLLFHTLKQHNFSKPYRKFRPQISVLENPHAWWKYAFRVISYELKGSRLRWSWGRMRQSYAGRCRYCELYERKLQYDFYKSHRESIAQEESQDLTALVESTFDTTPDDGAGPSLHSDQHSTDSNNNPQEVDAPRRLTHEESQELQNLEDGILGDMSVDDILLYRLLVHGRLGQGYQLQQQQAAAEQSFSESWVFGNRMVQNAMQNDLECQMEVKRLMAYMEHSSSTLEANDAGQEQLQNVLFLSVDLHWKEGCLSIFSPLPSTAREPSLLRRLHEKFLDFTFEQLSLGCSLMGDYETATIHVSLEDYKITEIRSNQARFAILSRRQPCQRDAAQANNNNSHTTNNDSSRVTFLDDEDQNVADGQGRQEVTPEPRQPLVFAEVSLNPPKEHGCGVMVKARVEAVEILLVPDCQWIRRLKEVLRYSFPIGTRDLDSYWEELNRASINAWASNTLGLQAKVEAAMEEHTPTSLDIEVQCPIIQILGEGDKKLWIDLGSAHLKTVKLAGIASANLKRTVEILQEQRNGSKRPPQTNGDTSVVKNLSSALDHVATKDYFESSDRSLGKAYLPSILGGFESSPAGPTFTFESHSVTSASKPSAFHKRERDQSWGFGEGDATTQATRQSDDIHSSFYDTYQLQFTSGQILVGEWCESVAKQKSALLSPFTVHVNLHKSIIPADHTLCRCRIDCNVGDVSARITPSSIVYLGKIARTWKRVMAAPLDDRSQMMLFSAEQRFVSTRRLSFSEPASENGSSKQKSMPLGESVDSGSRVDEDEFFDAVENDDNSEITMWLEDNWIADADSILDGDQDGATPRQRRPKTAMSDVSSLSDRSLKRRRRPKEAGAYLNEENLARLEERVVEEDSLEGIDNDSDSFHSAYSPGQIADLISEMEKTIDDTRKRLDVLQNKVEELSISRKNQSNRSVTSDSTKHRRLLKKSLRLEQDRLRAELNELVATRHDLNVQLQALEGKQEDVSHVHAPVRRASLLLSTSKTKATALDAIAMQHSLTRNLNPQLLQCTVVLNKLSVDFADVLDPQSQGKSMDTVVCVSNIALALRHSANETKAFLSVEHMSACYTNNNGSKSTTRYVLLGGSQYSQGGAGMLSSHFPQYLSTVSMEDKFLKCTLELRHKPTGKDTSSPPEVARVRVAFGDLEATPEPQLIETLLSCSSAIGKEIEPESVPEEASSSEVEKVEGGQNLPAYVDICVQWSSVRVVLNLGGTPVAALTVSEIAARFALSSAQSSFNNRYQVDLRCGNLQLLHIEDLMLGKGSEMVGRRDPYLPLFQVRLRSMLVPSSEVSGWVAGLKTIVQDDNDSKVWNTHLGVKVNSLSVFVAGQPVVQFLRSVEELVGALSQQPTNKPCGKPTKESEASSIKTRKMNDVNENSSRVPIRWRADVVVRKTSITIAGRDNSDRELPESGRGDSSRGSLTIMWTLLLSLEECPYKDQATCVDMALVDIGALRSVDEMQVIEPLDVLMRGHIGFSLQKHRAVVPNIKLPVDSPWNEIATVMQRHGWHASRTGADMEIPTHLSLLVTATKIHVSPQLLSFLVDFAGSFSTSIDHRSSTKPTAGDDIAEAKESDKSQALHSKVPDFRLKVALQSADIILNKSTGSFASFAVKNLDFDVHKRGCSLFLNSNVADVLVYDRSFRPGLCVASRKYYLRDSENGSEASPHFVSAKIQLSESLEATAVRINLHFGDIKFIVSPSLVQGLLSFQNELSALLKSDEETNSENDEANRSKGSADLMSTHIDFFFSFVVDGFECVFPSRDIPAYIREQANAAINVVSFRWKSSGEAAFILCGVEAGSGIETKLQSLAPGKGEFRELVDHCAAQTKAPFSKLIALKTMLLVQGFQILRTQIVALARSEKDISPFYFKVTRPTAGEQLITNSFDFNTVYNAFGGRICFHSDDATDDATTNLNVSFAFAHSLRLEAQLVDVLVYIAQSPGGINDSWRVSVAPILEVLSRTGEANPRRGDVSSKDKVDPEPSSLANAIKRASAIVSIQADGIRVTCVPGGATRLTENPIINFSLVKFSLGLGICPVSVQTNLAPEAALEGIVEKKPVVTRLREHHLMAGAWLNCELSASYHNRRLVAWEPFIEPWNMEVRFGADLVRLNVLPALPESDHSVWRTELEQGETVSAYTGDKLREIRNYLRSPFRRSVGNEKEAAEATAKQFPIDADFGYLMLALASNSLVSSALHKGASGSGGTLLGSKNELLSNLPSRNPMKWLVCFGHPIHETKSKSGASFSCSVSDSKPLNINLTGALIENLWGYLNQEKSRTVAPHWIRNDSGLTIRFREVLEAERVDRGERASKVTLSNGSEVPLSLRRTLSQSCDPHRAYILVELGSFEDTAGRLDHQEFDVQKGSLSNTFFYKVVAKVPVDTAGVHRYPLDRNVGIRTTLESDSRSLGWLIVRVALQGGIKLVSIESPLALKNDTDADLLCEVHAHNKLSLVWRCLLSRSQSSKQTPILSYVPVDMVPFVNDDSYEISVEALPRTSNFSHESELTSNGGSNAIQVRAPPPYSRSSLTKGLINELDISFKGLDYYGDLAEQVNLNVCSLRIGMFDASQIRSTSSDLIPEQRMLLFRSPLAFRNYLAFPIAVQVRIKKDPAGNRGSSASLSKLAEADRWEDLGILECGETASWTGALSVDTVELRVQFVTIDPETPRRFESWSTVVRIPPMSNGDARSDLRAAVTLPKLQIADTSGLPLELSLAIDDGSKLYDAGKDGIRRFASGLAQASRVVSFFVPYWLVDGTGQELEFSARSLVAGQFDARDDFIGGGEASGFKQPIGLTLGLSELLEDAKMDHLPSKSSFSILLLGDDRSKKLSIRQHLRRDHEGKGLRAPWSETVSLRNADGRHADVTVMPPVGYLKSSTGDLTDTLEPLALRSRVVSAPDKFGGKLGTKLVHVVCRYAIVNELGREVEIIAEHSHGKPVLIRADGRPTPFHFDDTGPIQFRPKEFGWVWSGRFYIRANRREVTLRIRHKLRRETIIVNAEIHSKQKSGTIMIFLRPASHPPFRFENNTMYPLQFVQTFLCTNEDDVLRNREVASSETILLPYHHEDFAWDEPEHARKSVQFDAADFGNAIVQPSMLGRFNLDRMAPGTELKMESAIFIGQVIADGPTRVIRISESSMPQLARIDAKEIKIKNAGERAHVTFSVSIRLTHGLGVSVIDWSPQELLFLRLEEISVTQRVDSSNQTIDGSIGRICIDNQLWVSPYPVLLEMGSKRLATTLAHIARRKNRRHRAITISICRPLISTSVYGDLTFLEWLDLVTDPINLYIDGNLANSIAKMMQQVIEIGSEGDDSAESLDSTLRKVLSLPESSDRKRKAIMGTADVYSAGDAVTTAAVAAKALSNRESMTTASTSVAGTPDQQPSLSKARKKCYVEKLRISTTKLEISWSGALPLTVPRLMPLSLTFEGLPLFLRPYSSSHAYGSLEDHLQSLQSHYLSVWRLFDVFLGLAAKPTFIINAFVYTWSESIASTLGSMSHSMGKAKENYLLKLREAEPQPIYEDGLPVSNRTSLGSFQMKMLKPFFRLLASLLQYCEGITGFGANLFRYDPTKFVGRKVGLVRTRNPRLFANVDGKDLLVEYTEGENAGKALLSRIRMGIHLGEGYIYHVEGLYQKVASVWSNSKKAQGSLILMITFERVVLVKGELSLDFCAVLWEVTFDNLIHVESADSDDAGFDLLTFWYLANSLREAKKGDEHLMARYAKSIVADADHGFENLLCTQVYIPHGHVDVLVEKAYATKKLVRV
ncbi:protein sorting-associated protein 13C [Seminavis robusta]|uniref:Protein sorting-associated protein 13C n=1 Tax=Seminavis robusta TaxID=568900 RepID=A0A9N8DN00_9STRA|nr:protein sorting-associated protein 13C [Seminavis robusta]|eukprot:Sro250_g099050.1 protein sorting-associated protein 13C (4123) ;mRNA; r:47213-59912